MAVGREMPQRNGRGDLACPRRQPPGLRRDAERCPGRLTFGSEEDRAGPVAELGSCLSASTAAITPSIVAHNGIPAAEPAVVATPSLASRALAAECRTGSGLVPPRPGAPEAGEGRG